MDKMKRVYRGLLLLVLLVVGMVATTACKTAEEIEVVADVTPEVEESTPEAVADTTPEIEESVEEVIADTQMITDMVGREVEIPTQIDRLFSVNNNGTILLYTLCPEKLVGWNSKISDASKAYMSDELAALPTLGSLYGNSSQNNPEEVIMSEPDIIVFLDASASEKVIEAADKIQSTLGIPVVMLKGGLNSYDKIYGFIGGIIGLEEKAASLSAYHRTSIDNVEKTVALIEEDEKVRVYYAREEDGLSTETSASPNAQLIELCGGVNVAVTEDVKVKSPIISIEQVVQWNPEVIFTGNAGFISHGTYKEVAENSDWSSIDAVIEGEVYATPQAPFNWFDRPPSVNRIVGLNYVLYKLYPEHYEGDIVKDVQEFYSLFYHYELTEEEARIIVGLE